MIAVVDYGVGNLFSLTSSLRAIGADVCVTDNKDVLKSTDKIILPGVGAFADAMNKLNEKGLTDIIKGLAADGKPLMGICLGMQVLFEDSNEYGLHKGLGLIPGHVIPISDVIPKGLKIPHMGWNSLALASPKHSLFSGISNNDAVYFVHSYFASGCDDYVIATADYGVPLTAAVAHGNICGCQFHPEKSGKTGLAILRAFTETEENL